MTDIEYLLKFILNSTTLSLTQIKDISDPTLTAAFTKKYAQTRRIRGFAAAPISGCTEVPLFNVPINEKDTKHKLIYCEVAVGSALYVAKEFATMFQPPSQYDSFIIRSTNSSIEALIDEQVDIKEFSYVVRDTSKVLPLYEVHFDYDRDLEERSRGNNVCEMCQKSASVMFCLAERASFCIDCDKKIHNNEFTMRHRRYYFNQVGEKKFIHCGVHADTLVDLFCLECCVPLCTTCKISGSHARAPHAAHELISYLEACNMLSDKIKEGEAELQEKKDCVEEYLSNFKTQVDEFRKNIAYVKNKIEEEYKAALNELQSIVRKKYQVINAKYLEKICVRRKMEHLKEFVENMDSAQLIRDYKSIVQQKSELSVGDLETFKYEPLILRGVLSLHAEEEENVMREMKSSSMDRSTGFFVETRGPKKLW